MLIEKGSSNRGVIYFFYDGAGIVDKYVSTMLEGLKPCVKDIFVVVNGKLSEQGMAEFRKYTEYVWERDNVGLDVGAYRHALENIGWDKIREYDELILMNHTIMGPIFPLREMFDSMAERDLDFWGTNIFYQVGFDPYGLTDGGYIRDHLQSHFHCVRRSLMEKPDYRAYWENLPRITNYKESVCYHETYFTHHFSELGYKWEAYADYEGLRAFGEYPMLKRPVQLIRETRCPFFKRRNFFHDNYADYLCSTQGEPAYELMEFLKNETDYDTDMIWENILRTCNQADIKNCLNLNYVVSSKNSPAIDDVLKTKKLALIYHFYYEECLENLLHYASSLPAEADIFITTGTEEKKALLEKAFEVLPNKLQVILVENRGRDVGALLVGAKDVIGAYDYICFAHDKVVKQLYPHSVGESWSYRCFDSILRNKHTVNNIVRLFEDNPRLGLLTPAPPNHGGYYPLLGDEWTGNYENVKELAEKLGYHVPIKKDKEPITPIGTIFWFRREAMQALFDVDWQYEDFPPEPAGNNGSLAHAIERIYSFAVQNEGFYPAWLFSDAGAGLEITNLHYMLRELAIIFEKESTGAYYYDFHSYLERLLDSSKDSGAVMTPALYLDHGEDFSEDNKLEVENDAAPGKLKAVFEFPAGKLLTRVRFDPCESGMMGLANLQIDLVYKRGKKKPIALESIITNGGWEMLEERNVLTFKNPDPWIILSWKKGFTEPVGLEVTAEYIRLDKMKKDK